MKRSAGLALKNILFLCVISIHGDYSLRIPCVVIINEVSLCIAFYHLSLREEERFVVFPPHTEVEWCRCDATDGGIQ